ncbi:MAG: dihydrodipicolinate synthase family protein [Anaerolineae bacterium]|nr:dihydrodipicolinate synthase family protein [Anaerolineae bacterium]
MAIDLPQECRRTLLSRFIGPRIPRLWCPPITHYADDGTLDKARQAAHWAKMARYVGGFLVPGSTGDGWEMSEEEIDMLLDATLDVCTQLETRILIGVLRVEVPTMLAAIRRTLERLKTRTGQDDALAAMVQARVCGFTVCPPGGADLTQAQIRTGLEAVLDLGVPVALYQLPQITQNEMSPALVADLATRYPNFILFKDTSGVDRVPEADRGRSGIFLVRGAEGDYAQWLRESGGPYHGLLLSTANSFPAQLGEMIALLESAADPVQAAKSAGQFKAAQALSDKLTRVVKTVFDLVAVVPQGNTFANVNKAIDYWMAHGPTARNIAPPRLHAGVRLPRDIILHTRDILADAGWLPERGYL